MRTGRKRKPNVRRDASGKSRGMPDAIDPETLAVYGLPPHQQPPDIYFGPGYEGRGGWSWYTGSAARMLDAAYAVMGLAMKDGEFVPPDDLFEPKGTLRVRSLTYRGRTLTPETLGVPASAAQEQGASER